MLYLYQGKMCISVGYRAMWALKAMTEPMQKPRLLCSFLFLTVKYPIVILNNWYLCMSEKFGKPNGIKFHSTSYSRLRTPLGIPNLQELQGAGMRLFFIVLASDIPT